jgi:hypothetical protein
MVALAGGISLPVLLKKQLLLVMTIPRTLRS